jgi:hypothetical protein
VRGRRAYIPPAVRIAPRLIGRLPVATLAMHGLVACVYLWYSTAGTLRIQPGGHYYELLGDAFLAGQLHLTIAPRPELLALPDPYDPVLSEPYRLHDATLYDGKYYLYWGPVPGLFHAAWKGLTGQPASSMLVLVLVGVGGYLWFRKLLRTLRALAFPHVPAWSVGLLSLCYALGGVGPYLQALPTVYHEAFVWASFFLLGGLYWWLRGLDGKGGSAWKLALAGGMFGCAVGSRTTVILYPLVAGLVLTIAWLRAPGSRRAIGGLLAFGIPLGAALALLALYNQARFGSPFEFGQPVGFGGANRGIGGAAGGFFVAPVPFNLAAYFLLTPVFIPYFPFLYSPRPPEWFNTNLWTLEQPFSSLLAVAPLVILAPLSPGVFLPGGRGAPAVVRLFVAAVGVATAATFGLMMTWLTASGRFMQDFLPGLCLLAAVGLWQLWPRCSTARLMRAACATLSVVLLVGSLVGGLTYGLNYLNRRDRMVYLHLAYRFDDIVTRGLRNLRPGLWQRTYFTTDVRDRPGGFFYEGAGTVILPVPPGGPIRVLRLESFFPDEKRVEIEIDGHRVDEVVLGTGYQVLRLNRDMTASPSGRAQLRLTAVGPDTALNGRLWPLQVYSLGAEE